MSVQCNNGLGPKNGPKPTKGRQKLPLDIWLSVRSDLLKHMSRYGWVVSQELSVLPPTLSSRQMSVSVSLWCCGPAGRGGGNWCLLSQKLSQVHNLVIQAWVTIFSYTWMPPHWNLWEQRQDNWQDKENGKENPQNLPFLTEFWSKSLIFPYIFSIYGLLEW